MMQGNNGQRDDTQRYALPEELRRRLIEASGYRVLTPTPSREVRPAGINVINLKQWLQQRGKVHKAARS
jgi:hypothetical protein